MSLTAINKIDFLNKVDIRANNIEVLFSRFKSRMLSVHSIKLNYEEEKSLNKEKYIKENEDKYLKFLKEAYCLNENKLIIDFYIRNLDEKSIDKICCSLNKEEVFLFKELLLKTDANSIYFLVEDEEILELIGKLNTRELFFSTFYFLKYDMTIWANYNLEFPVFYIEDDICSKYIEIAQKIGLYIRK